MKRNISGIYIIKNNINNKVYIGSAVCCKQRFIGHKSDFKKKQHNDRFQNFVNKYGVNSLVFEILEIVSNKQKLIEREQYWIDFYQSYKSKNGYNIAKIAGSTLGIKMPESHKDSCKSRMMGNKYRKDKKWTEQEKIEIGIRSKKNWADNPEKLNSMKEKLSLLKKGVPQWIKTPHPMLGKESPKIKTIIVYKDGVIIDEIKGVKNVCEKYNLDSAAVVRVCNNKLKTTKGLVLKYV